MALEHRDAISPAIAMRQGNSKRQLASHSLLSSRPLNCQQEEMDKWIKSFLRISNTSKPLPAHGEVSESIHRTDEDDDDDDDDKAVDRSSTFSSQDSDSDERLSSRPHLVATFFFWVDLCFHSCHRRKSCLKKIASNDEFWSSVSRD